MQDRKIDKIKRDIMSDYLNRTKKSKEHFNKARKWIPGGSTRTVAHFAPHPFFASEGRGCSIYDSDGNKYYDYVNCFTANIHGHSHPHVIKAIESQMKKGISYSAPADLQYRLAELLCNRIPGMDLIRFCNSGTEATMFAMRAARVYTGKNGFICMDGGYHGSHDFVGVNNKPDLESTGLPKAKTIPGVPSSVLNDIFVAPFNDLDSVERIIISNKGKIAAVMMEPMIGAGGGIPPEDGYLKGMRELTNRYDILLIFDEVITFRFNEGGFQAIEEVIPDLTTLGKIIGGGLPVGAFGGRKEIMSIFDQTKPDCVVVSGTFSGNPLTMAAGLANMEMYDQKEIDRINKLGNRLRNGFTEVINRLGIAGQCLGYGSLVQLVFSADKIRNVKDIALALAPFVEFLKYLHLDMLNQGIFYIQRGTFSISTPMIDQNINEAIKTFECCLETRKTDCK